MRLVIVGAGSWGTAVAALGARSGPVRLVCRTAAQAQEIAATRVNSAYLPGVTVPEAVEITHLDDAACLQGADLVISALPSRAVHDAGPRVAALMPAGAGLLSLTKGLDPVTGGRLSATWRGMLGDDVPLCVLSGPNHAEEVAERQPTAAVVAGDRELGRRVQERLSGPRFRLYLNDDLTGVELCGAGKNVIALAAGMSDGLGFGDNCKATLITRGLAEMTRLGRACGARDATYRGLAGMGDLVATCTSRHSRNRRAGELIAGGMAVADVERELGQVAEGLWTVRHLLALADRAGVELPISAEVLAVTVDGRPVHRSLEALMTRALPAEE